MKKTDEIRSLTGLRGIASLYVMFYHFQIYNFLPKALGPFSMHGYLAVDLFFVLSGFVMAMIYRKMFAGSVTVAAFKNFLGKRIGRVYPLYLFATLFTLAYLAVRPQDIRPDTPLTAGAVFANLAMVQSWGIAHSYALVAWSISTEWAAYLLFPLLVKWTLFNSKNGSLLVYGGCLAGLATLTLLPVSVTGIAHDRGPLNLWDGTTLFPLARCLLEFTLGLCAFRASTSDAARAWLEKDWVGFSLLASLLIALAIPGSDIFVICLLPPFIAGLSRDATKVAKLLGWKPVKWFGDISYSLYLVHHMTLWIGQPIKTDMLAKGLPAANLIPLLVEIAVAISVAALVHYTIEEPSRDFLRKWLDPDHRVPRENNPNLAGP